MTYPGEPRNLSGGGIPLESDVVAVLRGGNAEDVISRYRSIVADIASRRLKRDAIYVARIDAAPQAIPATGATAIAFDRAGNVPRGGVAPANVLGTGDFRTATLSWSAANPTRVTALVDGLYAVEIQHCAERTPSNAAFLEAHASVNGAVTGLRYAPTMTGAPYNAGGVDVNRYVLRVTISLEVGDYVEYVVENVLGAATTTKNTALNIVPSMLVRPVSD